MKIEVLGCHGSETPTANTVGFLINDQLLLEAGTASSVLPMERQKKVKSVIISHLHLDHIKSLPFLVDNRIDDEIPPIKVYGIPEVIQGLKTHLFNDSIWPDLTKIINGHYPLLEFQDLVPGERVMIDHIEVTPITVNHAVPAAGLLIRKDGRSVLYSADTGPTMDILKIGEQTSDLAAVIFETSFPDRLQKIATVSGHMTPSLLAREIEKMNRPEVPVYVFHMKPKYEQDILKELDRLLGDRVHVLQEGQVLQF